MISPNGITIPDADINIWQAYDFQCVGHPGTYAVCLHEEPPKSKNPDWRNQPETRFPVCNDCHNLVHSMARVDAAFYLEQSRNRFFPEAVSKL